MTPSDWLIKLKVKNHWVRNHFVDAGLTRKYKCSCGEERVSEQPLSYSGSDGPSEVWGGGRWKSGCRTPGWVGQKRKAFDIEDRFHSERAERGRKEDCGSACPFSLADHCGAEALTRLLRWDSKWVEGHRWWGGSSQAWNRVQYWVKLTLFYFIRVAELLSTTCKMNSETKWCYMKKENSVGMVMNTHTHKNNKYPSLEHYTGSVSLLN